jgi:hypothetical protein
LPTKRIVLGLSASSCKAVPRNKVNGQAMVY